MKKIGALLFASFYLMLTTGMFVCMLYCSGKFLFIPAQHDHDHGKSGLVASGHSKETGHSAHKEKDCKCCDQHGEYLIKENIKTGGADADLKASNTLLTCIWPSFLGLAISKTLIYTKKWPENTGPPIFLKEPLYISNRVLLI